LLALLAELAENDPNDEALKQAGDLLASFG
jgi:hypothetical protein